MGDKDVCSADREAELRGKETMGREMKKRCGVWCGQQPRRATVLPEGSSGEERWRWVMGSQ